MFIARTIFYFFANTAALLLLNYLVDGFDLLVIQPINLVTAALIFTFLNMYIRPVIKYALTTFIIISLGLLSLVINAGILVALDFLSEHISINGLMPLVYSALIMAVANTVIALISKIFFFNRFLYR